MILSSTVIPNRVTSEQVTEQYCSYFHMLGNNKDQDVDTDAIQLLFCITQV